MATHSSILAWRISWTEEPGRITVHGVAKSRTRLSNYPSLTTSNNMLDFIMLRLSKAK